MKYAILSIVLLTANSHGGGPAASPSTNQQPSFFGPELFKLSLSPTADATPNTPERKLTMVLRHITLHPSKAGEEQPRLLSRPKADLIDDRPLVEPGVSGE